MDIPIGLNLPDQSHTDPLGQALYNTIVSPLGVKIRPGATDLIDLTSAVSIDGIFDWQEQNLVIAVTNGGVWRMNDAAYTSDGGSYLLLESGDRLLLQDGGKLSLEAFPAVDDVSGAVALEVGVRATFANYGDFLYIANGGKIQELHPVGSFVTNGSNDYQCILNHTAVAGAGGTEPGVATASATYWTDLGAGSSYDAWVEGTRYGSGNADVLEDTEAPTTVAFIATIDTYLMALEVGSERLWWSYPGRPYQWDGDFTSAEYLPDDVVCMLAVNSDVYVGGKRSIQIFQNDGITPWVPTVYGSLSYGVLAPYSFKFCKDINAFIWIDDNRRLVKLEGRTVTPLNDAFNTQLHDIGVVSDAIADFVVLEGTPYYLLYFPESDRSFSVNLSNNTYAEWSTGEGRWIGNCITNVPNWDMVVIGDKADGILKTISTTISDDAGTAFTPLIRTMRIPSGDVLRTPRLLVHFTKIVDASAAGTASLSVRWRDDGKDWVTARTMDLSDIQDTDFVRSLYRLGHFRNYRQYEFDCSNLWPFSIAKVEQI
jgi:hypothetical protein